MQAGTPVEMQISVLAKMQHLEARLAPDLRDEARVRTAHLVSLVKARTRSEPSQPTGALEWTSASIR